MNIFKTIWEKTKQAGRWIKAKWKILLVTIGIASVMAAPTVIDLTRNEVSLTKLQSKYEQSVKIKDKYQLDGGSLKMVNIKNSELTSKGEVKDKIVVEIGGKEKEDFEPSVKISRWDEVSFKIKPDLKDVKTKDKNLKFEGDKIKFKTPKMDFEMYEDENGYKYIWYLKEKPKSRTVCFDIESNGLDFYHQSPLDEEMAGQECWTEECTATDCCDSHRPEEIVGSYAIYHSTKGGMNDINDKEYKIGKFGHIPTPKLYDSNNWELFAERLLIEDGKYCVVMSEDFWDNAVYPIKSNDTFGKTTTGASVDYSIDGMIGTKFTAPDGVREIESITWHGASKADTGYEIKGIIIDSSLEIISNGIGNAVNVPIKAAWHKSSFSTEPTCYKDAVYYLTVVPTDSTEDGRYDSGDTNQTFKDSDNSFTAPVDPVGVSYLDDVYSVYATYKSILSPVYFTETGTNAWVIPTGVTSLDIECWGAGGGPGLRSYKGGGGGGGGAYATEEVSVTAGVSYDFIVGAGTSTETAGGDSYFDDGSEVLAKGGSGGFDTAGGTGGLASASVGTTKYNGGTGGVGDDSSDVGGGAGGAAGPSGIGGDGDNSVPGDNGGDGGTGNNGNGGAGGTGSSQTGVAGGAGGYNLLGGGGGGGGYNTASGGAGGFCGGGAGGGEYVTTSADGMIKVTYVVAAGPDAQINIGDAWKVIELMKINIGDVWKDVEGGWINIGDSWKTFY